MSLALADGTRVDDCTLVSVGRGGAGTAWLTSGSDDLFVPWNTVVDVWAAPRPR